MKISLKNNAIYPQNDCILKRKVSVFKFFAKVFLICQKTICLKKTKISPQNYAIQPHNDGIIKSEIEFL